MLHNQIRPNNWEKHSVQEIFSLLPNLSFSRRQLTNKAQTLGYIHYGDIHTGCLDELISVSSILPYLVNEQFVKNINKYLLRPGDIVLVDASENYDGIAKLVEISNIGIKKLVAGLHTIPLRPLKGTFAPGFARYLFKHTIVSKTLKAIAQGTKVFSISFSLIQKVKLFLPPIEEQQKIVEVLETWDKAIQLTRKLIEQQELQKKYLMQQLLTGRTRLKGFTEKWKTTKLGKICSITTGRLDANAMVDFGQYKFFTCSKEVFFIDKFAFDTEALLISGNGNIGYIHYYKGKFNAYQRTYVLDSFSKNIFFTKYILELALPKRLAKETKVGSMPYIVLSTLRDMKLQYPSQKEQNAIAKILQNTDKEIDLLREKLAQLEEQKRGLMQILLTGKVRLNW